MCRLARTLAWAATHNIPFDEALSATLPWGGRPALVATGSARGNTYGVIHRLRRGLSLADSLRQRLGRRLPEYYLSAVRDAELDGSLPTALPLLAERLAADEAAKRSPTAWGYGALYAVALGGVLSVVLLGAFGPSMGRMWKELLPGRPLPFATAFLLRHQEALLRGAAPLLGAALLCLLARRLYHDSMVFSNLVETVVLPLPLFGRRLRLRRVAELLQGMIVALEAGKDVVAAAEWNGVFVRSWWLRARLARCRDALAAGVRWDRAWAEMKLGLPLGQWILGNGASREEPARLFRVVYDLVQERLVSQEHWLELIARLAYALVLGALVAFVMLAVLLPLMQGIRVLAELP